MSDKNIWDALCSAQAEFPVIGKSEEADTGAYKYKYADLAAILSKIMPILAKNELCLTQHTRIEDGVTILQTRITHISGEHIESDYPVCSITSSHQNMGSALTYARRYGLSSLASIAVGGEDDDGAGAATVEDAKPQPKQGRSESLLKADALVNWLPDCKSVEKLEEAEGRAVLEIKPNISEGDWLRLEAEMNATFSRLADKENMETK